MLGIFTKTVLSLTFYGNVVSSIIDEKTVITDEAPMQEPLGESSSVCGFQERIIHIKGSYGKKIDVGNDPIIVTHKKNYPENMSSTYEYQRRYHRLGYKKVVHPVYRVDPTPFFYLELDPSQQATNTYTFCEDPPAQTESRHVYKPASVNTNKHYYKIFNKPKNLPQNSFKPLKSLDPYYQEQSNLIWTETQDTKRSYNDRSPYRRINQHYCPKCYNTYNIVQPLVSLEEDSRKLDNEAERFDQFFYGPSPPYTKRNNDTYSSKKESPSTLQSISEPTLNLRASKQDKASISSKSYSRYVVNNKYNTLKANSPFCETEDRFE